MSKSKRTRAHIVESAILTFSQTPQATLSDVADAAAIGRATLHRHFSSRDELLKTITLTALTETEAACRPLMDGSQTSLETLQNLFETSIPMGDRFYFLSHEFGVMEDAEIKQIYDGQLDVIRQLVLRLKADKVIDASIPDQWVTHTIDSLIYSAWSCVNEGVTDVFTASDLAIRTLIKGLGAEK